MNKLIIAVIIFILTYVGIASEKINKAIVALIGAVSMLLLKVIDQHEAFQEIDLNVIFLLIGMMLIVHITSETGVFQWITIKLAQFCKGKPIPIILMLLIITAFLSALLDNVTTVILVAPITMLVMQQLELNPIPVLILEAIASNIGGAATLIGDPPNILIGSAANLSFIDFVINMAPVIVIVFAVYLYSVYWLFNKRGTRASSILTARIMGMDASSSITDYKTLIKSLSILFLVLLGFCLHGVLHLEPATVALSGAFVLIFMTKKEVTDVFKHVEWETIFFFIGLFIIVAGVVHVGIIGILSNKVLNIFGNNLRSLSIFIIWFGAISSSIVDNIPFVATLIPLLKELGLNLSQSLNIPVEVIMKPLWWSLALGTCLGGNGSLIGASANVIIAGLAQKSGYKISFFEFSKYGFLFMIQSLIISTIYVVLRYY